MVSGIRFLHQRHTCSNPILAVKQPGVAANLEIRMAILTVGLGEQFAKISDAIAAPQNGDTINVDAGTYVNDYVSISKNITLQGIGGMIKLVSIGLIPNGKAIFITSGNITIDNFEFSGATVSDGNPQSPDELDWFILLSPDSPDEMASGQLRAPIPVIRSSPYAGSGNRPLTDATGERRNWQFGQRFRGFWSCRLNPSGKSRA